MKESAVITIIAILSLAWIESIALLVGINGQLLMIVLMVIGSLAGYQGHKFLYARKRRR